MSCIFESLIQKCRKQAILERLRCGLVCLSNHVLTKPAAGAGLCNIIQEVMHSWINYPRMSGISKLDYVVPAKLFSFPGRRIVLNLLIL